MKNKFIYQFKITLLDTQPPIWRRIQVRADISLLRFSTTIILAMGWNGKHLHQFHNGGRRYGMPTGDTESDRGIIDERKVALQDFSKDDLKSFKFEYDFGDGWVHSVELEEVFEAKKGERFPKCVDGARHCPPEDCGGPGGYEDFLTAIKDPNHPKHKSMTEWIRYKFNPEVFNLDLTNSDLRDAKRTEEYWWRYHLQGVLKQKTVSVLET